MIFLGAASVLLLTLVAMALNTRSLMRPTALLIGILGGVIVCALIGKLEVVFFSWLTS